MGWEKRGNQLYYYRKVRDGNRVRSVYVGNNFWAQLEAILIENNRRIQQEKRGAFRRMQQADEELDRQIKEEEKVVTAITEARLHAAGYHKHRGQWRKKRHDTKATASA